MCKSVDVQANRTMCLNIGIFTSKLPPSCADLQFLAGILSDHSTNFAVA